MLHGNSEHDLQSLKQYRGLQQVFCDMQKCIHSTPVLGHVADDDHPNDGAAGDAGFEEGELGDDSGWGDTASSPQHSLQTQQGGSAMQTSDHSQVDSYALLAAIELGALLPICCNDVKTKMACEKAKLLNKRIHIRLKISIPLTTCCLDST